MQTFEEPNSSILRGESADVSHNMGSSFENSSLPLGASPGMPRPFSQVLLEEPAEQGTVES